ncbi:MAG: YbaK/EbsC family protein [Candidatus Caldarchaeum sp.]|nr:YbaK/EbsC family protein [Candidatus Caldarchaeum sp.]
MLDVSDLKKFMKSKGVEGELVFLEPEQAKTSLSAASAVGCQLSQIAKNIVLKGRKAYFLVVIAGDRRVDLKKLSKFVQDDVRLATPEEVLMTTGYPPGAVPPFGHRTNLKVYIDQSLKQHEYVYTSGGADNVLLKLRVDSLVEVSGGELVGLSGQFIR